VKPFEATPASAVSIDEGCSAFDAEGAARHLAARDMRLGELIRRVGPCRLRQKAAQSTFEALAESIIYQQLTGKAAGTIHARVQALFIGSRFAPETLLAIDDAALRGAGVSRGKIIALRDLAARTLDGTVPPIAHLSTMADEAIINRLVTVRGIGRWTAEMLLIFRLGRPDVLPVGDLGVRQGFKLAYRKRTMPTSSDLARFGEAWRPYRTAASWYLWRAVDLLRPAVVPKVVPKESTRAQSRAR